MSGFFMPEEWVYEIGYENYGIEGVKVGLLPNTLFITTQTGKTYIFTRESTQFFHLYDTSVGGKIAFNLIVEAFEYIKTVEEGGKFHVGI